MSSKIGLQHLNLDNCRNQFNNSFLKIQKDLPFIKLSNQKKYTLKKGFSQLWHENSGSVLTSQIKTARHQISSVKPQINNRKEVEFEKDPQLALNFNIPSQKCGSIKIELNSKDQQQIISPLASIKDKGLYNTQFGFNTIKRLINSEKASINNIISKTSTEQKSIKKFPLQRPSFYQSYKNFRQPVDALGSIDEFLKRRESLY